jgi:hypothetical protein
MWRNTKLIIAGSVITGCSAVADFAATKIMGASSDGISAELTVGDKEQVVGSNIEVKSDKVDKVVGNSDNSTKVDGAQTVEVTNVTYPAWLIIALLISNFITLCLPTPTQMWEYLKRNKQ